VFGSLLEYMSANDRHSFQVILRAFIGMCHYFPVTSLCRSYFHAIISLFFLFKIAKLYAIAILIMSK
jgi:hypothetical protein